MSSCWAWIVENPGAAGWLLFAALTAFVFAWTRFEDRLVAWAKTSSTKADDRLVASVGRLVSLLAILLDFAREFAPHFAAKRKERPNA